jgi:hypothetical protein
MTTPKESNEKAGAEETADSVENLALESLADTSSNSNSSLSSAGRKLRASIKSFNGGLHRKSKA